jgi:glycosyltransferase involved in cell wall biosynthesis
MRVLEVVADGDPGGGTTHVVQILEGLRQEYSLGLVTQRESYLSHHAESLGVPVFGMDFFRSRLDPRAPIRLSRIVQEFDPQLVHLHGGRAAFFAALASPKAPTIYSVHGYHFLHKNTVMRRLALSAERLAARRAKEIVFVSRYDASVAEDYKIASATGRRTIILNSVPLPEGSGAHADPRHVGFAGRLEHQKDPSLFLDVMEKLPEYHATMIGRGTLEAEVKAEIERRSLFNVRMLGALPHSELLEALPGFGVVVMTSRWEGLPILPLEAMWLGVPVVAANVGALDEIIEHEKSGLLVDSRSPEDFVRAVERLAEDTELRERIVKSARDRIRSHFSEKRMLADIWTLYQRAAKG